VLRNVVFIFFILLAYSHARAFNLLKSVTTAEESNQSVTVYEFAEPVDPTMVQTTVRGKAVQVVFPNSEMASDKNSLDVGKNGLLRVESAFESPDVIKSSINFEQELAGGTGGEPVRLVADQNKLKVYVATSSPRPQQKESEIPVLSAAKDTKKIQSKSPYTKLALSIFMIVAFSAGLIYFSKWYSKNNKKSAETNKIRILTQHHLGPRKNLMIVRVAGETLLLGVTDHNINLIKSLSLMDEEIPAAVPSDFTQSLSAADSKSSSQKAEVEVDEFVIGNIKDKISTKLKGMRNI
jgi:flagellar protein FliO/FliZ